MKNLLKLALLLSVFAIANINAIKIQSGDQYFMSPNKITLVNDLGYDVNVGGEVLPAGKTQVLNENKIEQLGGMIKVEKLPTKELVGYVSYLYVPADFGGMKVESYDEVVKNLSDITKGKSLIK